MTGAELNRRLTQQLALLSHVCDGAFLVAARADAADAQETASFVLSVQDQVLKSERWHSTITTATLGNLRITGENGFGFSSGGFSSLAGEDLSPAEGWRKIYDASSSPEYSPHYVSCES